MLRFNLSLHLFLLVLQLDAKLVLQPQKLRNKKIHILWTIRLLISVLIRISLRLKSISKTWKPSLGNGITKNSKQTLRKLKNTQLITKFHHMEQIQILLKVQKVLDKLRKLLTKNGLLICNLLLKSTQIKRPKLNLTQIMELEMVAGTSTQMDQEPKNVDQRNLHMMLMEYLSIKLEEL